MKLTIILKDVLEHSSQELRLEERSFEATRDVSGRFVNHVILSPSLLTCCFYVV